MPVYPAPKPGIGGLGVHLTPTIDGNIIIGPSAEYIDDNSNYACTAPVMEKLFSEAKMLGSDGNVTTPIEAGNIEISSNIRVTYSLIN